MTRRRRHETPERRERAGPARTPPHAPAAGRPDGRVLLLLAAIVLVAFDVFRIGYFADDFIFLDAARRHGLIDLLSGRFGIWPWYRPLSRELYFALATRTGAPLVVTHVLSLLCLFGSLVWLWRIGRRMVGARAAAVAALLFATYESTKFLTAWASGFQDLLALFLILGAVDAEQRGRPRLALTFAVLSVFAKETGFLAFAFLAGLRLSRPGAHRIRRLVAPALAGAAAVAVHVVVRLGWHNAPPIPPDVRPEYFWQAAREALAGFGLRAPEIAWSGVPAAIVAGAIAAYLLLRVQRADPDDAPRTPGFASGIGGVGVAAALSIAPVLAVHLFKLTYVSAYQFFPSIPWITLLLGAALVRLPRDAWLAGVTALVAWNAAGLAYRSVDLDVSANWRPGNWHWNEAMRLSTATRRFERDLRRDFAARPGSLVILYDHMPPGVLFQTQDGPASREALHDPSVRAYWISSPPAGLDAQRLAIVTFDPDRLHLERLRLTTSRAVTRSMGALICGWTETGRAFLSFASPDSARFDRAYLEAAAALIDSGPSAFLRPLAAAGLDDTLGDAPALIAAPIAAASPRAGRAFETVLRFPRTVRAHESLADVLAGLGNPARAALELRIAVTLDPAAHEDRYRLASLLWEVGASDAAVAELTRLTGDPAAGAAAEEARSALDRIRGIGAPSR